MSSQDERSYYLSGTHLWRTVIHRAIQEADGEEVTVVGRHETREGVQRDAREWLLGLDDAPPAAIPVPVVPAGDKDDCGGSPEASGDALRTGAPAASSAETKVARAQGRIRVGRTAGDV